MILGLKYQNILTLMFFLIIWKKLCIFNDLHWTCHQPECSMKYHLVNKTKIISFPRKQILCYGICRHHAANPCSSYSQKLYLFFFFSPVIPEIKRLIISFWTCKHLHTSSHGKTTGNIRSAKMMSLLSAMIQIKSKIVFLRRGNKTL